MALAFAETGRDAVVRRCSAGARPSALVSGSRNGLLGGAEAGPGDGVANSEVIKPGEVVLFVKWCGSLMIPQLQIRIQEGGKVRRAR